MGLVRGLAVALPLLAAACGDTDTARADAPEIGVAKATGAVPVGSAGAARHETFATFWPAFRTALLARDAGAAAGMTRFPLVVRGELDDDPRARVGRKGFAATFERLLRHAEDPIGAPEATLSDRLRQDAAPVRPATAAVASYGPMRFEKTPQGWKLTTLFIGAEE